MSQQFDSDNIQVQVEDNRVKLKVTTQVYAQNSILGAAYIFTDRCYVFIDKTETDQIEVNLTGQNSLKEQDLQALVGEFSNELLAQELRKNIVSTNRSLIETIVSRSLGAATPPELAIAEFDLSELEELELDDDEFDDPLGIAVSWEDKFGKEKKEKKEQEKADNRAEATAETPVT
jgi:His-Xaa-Ser system protein HxsD